VAVTLVSGLSYLG